MTDGLFSHAQPSSPAATTESVEPIYQQVDVPVDTDRAFEGFTEYIHLWWPAEIHSKFGPGTHVSLDAEGLGEESESGEHYLWAALQHAEAGAHLELRFTEGFEHLAPSRVRVSFTATVDGARIDVVHDWFDSAEGRAQRERYGFWSRALHRYARFMGASTGDPA
ncbi:hypothetical protein GCM10027591_04680 [Zhihengliuella somnathii]